MSLNIYCCLLQEKERRQLERAARAETKLKEKAVKQHEVFKEAVKLLRRHGMGAKKGRVLLKRHYVALIEDVGGVEDPGTYYVHYHSDNTPYPIHLLHTHLPAPHSHPPPPPLTTTRKIKGRRKPVN